MIKLKGLGVSSGISIGKAHCIGKDEFVVEKRKITHEEVSREIYRLEEALIETRKEIVELQQEISKDLNFTEAKIFEAHLLVLEDRVLIEDVIKQIKNKKVNVEFAFSESIKKYMNVLLKVDDDYLRERAIDIDDIGKRVMRKILHKDLPKMADIKDNIVVVAHDLSPVDTASLPKAKVLGFVTDIGGKTSHSSIIARSLSIPAVVGLAKATENVKEGDTVIVDGTSGMVVINPTERVLKSYQTKIKELKKIVKVVVDKDKKGQTLDGRKVIVSANIEIPEELPLVKEFGAQGIGLYRTEFIFLGRMDLPSEEEQYQAYVKVAKAVSPDSVVIRTIDIGGDKFLSRPEVPKEFAPFLGWRAIRFCLARKDIFKVQLRAILRASASGNIEVMFPMVSGIEELRKAKAMLEECKEELRKEKIKFDENILVGTMIEVPSAALTADKLAKESDFFSIGTNDLIQYSIAVDRANEKVAYLYQPAHPAVILLIRNIIEAAHKNKIWVGMCGEMASEDIFTPLLVGMGIDKLSMSPPQIPVVKNIINNIKQKDAEKIYSKVIDLSTPGEIEKTLQDELKIIVKRKA